MQDESEHELTLRCRIEASGVDISPNSDQEEEDEEAFTFIKVYSMGPLSTYNWSSLTPPFLSFKSSQAFLSVLHSLES